MDLGILRVVDIELTNRCNATCSFCPREKTPKQGFMDFAVFQRAVSRVKEFGPATKIFLTGLGEPMLHPRFSDCVAYLASEGFVPAFTTNGSRLFKEVASDLLDKGLGWIDFSVSDLGDAYKDVYNLEFATTLENIKSFLAVNNGRAHVQVTIVRHDGNQEALDEMQAFWRGLGIAEVRVIKEINRGGSCSKEYYFQSGEKYKSEARARIKKAGFSEVCASPFGSIFIGWDGRYYLCCMDWEKTVPLGNVTEHSILEMDEMKMRFLHGDAPICGRCSVNPVNDICEIMHQVERGERGKFAVANRLNTYKDANLDLFASAVKEWGQSRGILIASDAHPGDVVS